MHFLRSKKLLIECLNIKVSDLKTLHARYDPNYIMEKTRLFKDILREEILDIPVFQGLCFSGIPDNLVFRPVCWQILLKYLPVIKKDRPSSLISHRKRYLTILESILCENSEECQDHPLNSNPNSYWSTYFKDNEVLLQINKDVRRLCPHMQFFQELTKFPNTLPQVKSLTQRVHLTLLRNENVTKHKTGVIKFSQRSYSSDNWTHGPTEISSLTQSSLDMPYCSLKPHENTSYEAFLDSSNHKTNIDNNTNIDNDNNDKIINNINNSAHNTNDHLIEDNKPKITLKEYHWEVCQRILFAYAKLNPGQSYIQGMNEILGPIYYVMANNRDEYQQKYAEHDTFFCFTQLMSEIRDNFIPHMDIDKNHGIGAQMKKLNDILERIDPALLTHFRSQDLHLNYFCYRWLMLLFSQEFRMPDVIRLWDSIFSTNDKGTFCLYIATAMLILLRNELLVGDFAHNLKLLQNYPNIDILKIISKSLEIEEEDRTNQR